MSLINRLSIFLKAFSQLGAREVRLYACYQLGLKSGYLRWKTRTPGGVVEGSVDRFNLQPVLALPDREALQTVLGESGREQLLAEANEIVEGRVRLFGGEPVPLELRLQRKPDHWTLDAKGSGMEDRGDVKFVWEPGRFGWALALARAYYISGEERYARAFWEHTTKFMDANQPYLGPHWSSAQEVGLRLIALVFAAQVFRVSINTSPERLERLGRFVAASAARIPPTLVYARAQNNNHLLSEALGLYTAGLALADHPQARRWVRLGWRWFNRGIQMQVAEDGVYIQHSANYHRLMLQLALWANSLLVHANGSFIETTHQRLAAATRWLLALVDSASGHAPNLGPNDGAYILPLTVCPFADYRPVLQAASRAFLGRAAFEGGQWDEMSLWLGDEGKEIKDGSKTSIPYTVSPIPYILRHPTLPSWAYLRAARFTSRPGHADQFHLDLWWHGLNVAQDAGTYLYNAPAPWDNSLTCTAVHNTVRVNGLDQMYRAGKFLWLDWAQPHLVDKDQAQDGATTRLVVQHDGYRKLGLLHQRVVAFSEDGDWWVEDRLVRAGKPRAGCYSMRLHWLLPDWEWQIVANSGSIWGIRLSSPYGKVVLQVEGRNSGVLLVRAGKLLHGAGVVAPILGWVSPTYGVKLPALSLTVEATGNLPISLVSRWRFPVVELA